jgi:group I intron endonuclease
MTPLAFSAYLVTCETTGKRYIGITSGDVARRWKDHIYYSRRRRSRASALSDAIRKYGPEVFSVLEVCAARSLQDAVAVERILIQQFGTFAPVGYNLTLGGEGRFGYRPSPESVEQSAAKHRGRPCHPNTRLAGRRTHLGKQKTLPHRERIAAAKRGVHRSEATKAKLRAYWAARRDRNEFTTSQPYEHHARRTA